MFVKLQLFEALTQDRSLLQGSPVTLHELVDAFRPWRDRERGTDVGEPDARRATLHRPRKLFTFFRRHVAPKPGSPSRAIADARESPLSQGTLHGDRTHAA